MKTQGKTSREIKIIIVKKLLKRDGHNCWLCGYKLTNPLNENPQDARLKFHTATIDHVVPKSLGGSKKGINNMKLAHYCCNHLRANQPVTDDLRAACEGLFFTLWRDYFDRLPERVSQSYPRQRSR